MSSPWDCKPHNVKYLRWLVYHYLPRIQQYKSEIKTIVVKIHISHRNINGHENNMLKPIVLSWEYPSRGQLAMSGNIFDGHNWRERCCWRLMGRGQEFCWTCYSEEAGPIQRTAPFKLTWYLVYDNGTKVENLWLGEQRRGIENAWLKLISFNL